MIKTYSKKKKKRCDKRRRRTFLVQMIWRTYTALKFNDIDQKTTVESKKKFIRAEYITKRETTRA